MTDPLRYPHRPSRDQCGYSEATRDPIFLFQYRRWIVTGVPDGYDVDDEGSVVKKGWEHRDDDRDPMPMAELAEHPHGDWDTPCAIEVWETDRVWFSREEAEAYGKARAYNYPDGWRVYCVCCEGELAARLNEVTQAEEPAEVKVA